MKSKNCGKYFKMLFKDCFYKLYDKNIMTEEIVIESLKNNDKLFTDISIDKRIEIMNAIQEIRIYNPDFTVIKINYVVDSDNIINCRNFYNLVKNSDNKYNLFYEFQCMISDFFV